MKKVHIIENCLYCSHVETFYEIPNYCSLNDMALSTNNAWKIPKFCPLPNAEPDPIELIAKYKKSFEDYLLAEFGKDEPWEIMNKAREELFNLLPTGGE